jgi:hypothetical protein
VETLPDSGLYAGAAAAPPGGAARRKRRGKPGTSGKGGYKPDSALRVSGRRRHACGMGEEGGEMKTVALEKLTGLHTLSGVETGFMDDEKEYEGMVSCNYISFILDGKKYTAVEDPLDGYRSSMDRLIVDKGKLKNTFPDTQVLVVFTKDNRYFISNSLVCFYAIDNAQIVLEVGTETVDDYYPSFVASFHPENLPVNAGKKVR